MQGVQGHAGPGVKRPATTKEQAVQIGVQHDQRDVLDGCERKTLSVEPACGEERVATNGAKAGPERRRGTCALLVDVMVQEISEDGHDSGMRRIVVVGPEERRERRLSCKRR